ncbi:MAG TPA: sigma-70 family RNA polymerase sigma factor [Chthoniobacterales bacterium]
METALTTALTTPLEPGAETVGISSERFDEIIQQNQRRVYRVIFLLVRDRDVADTLTQECFLRAYRKRATFRGECRLDTWLLRIAVNLVRDQSKSRRAQFWRKLVGLDDEESESAPSRIASAQISPERQLLVCEELQAVWDVAASLSQQQRTIFLLRFAEEMSLAEIAAVLGLKTGTVKAHLFRATEKVRAALKERT